MQKMFCANETCPKHTVHTGGEFVYSPIKRAFFCKECATAPDPIMNGAKNLWEFDTTHFNGEKIHVRSLNHLRQLEKQYGCSNHAANNMQSAWNTPPSHPGQQTIVPDRGVSVGRGRPQERR